MPHKYVVTHWRTCVNTKLSMKIYRLSEARTAFKTIMSDVCNDNEPVVVTRKRGVPVVVMSLQDYNSAMETQHLQSSPANAKRLAHSIAQVHAARGKVRRMVG